MRFAERRATPTAAQAGTIRIDALGALEFGGRLDEAMDIYARAMHYPPSAAGQRAASARKHLGYAGFAARGAFTDDGTLVGFGYGYTTRPGQWWHDLVHRALARTGTEQWLMNAFELSELHVEPHLHGGGIGRRLLTSLAGDLPHDAILLSTPDADTRAFRLYRSTGFVDLARNYLFPGDARPFAVLGARLPLADAA